MSIPLRNGSSNGANASTFLRERMLALRRFHTLQRLDPSRQRVVTVPSPSGSHQSNASISMMARTPRRAMALTRWRTNGPVGWLEATM